jgi:hypothetical protein
MERPRLEVTLNTLVDELVHIPAVPLWPPSPAKIDRWNRIIADRVRAMPLDPPPRTPE